MRDQLKVSGQVEIEDIETLGKFANVFKYAKKMSATDLYIVENSPIRIGILKNYTLYQDNNGSLFCPSRYEIDTLVDKTMNIVTDDDNHNYREYGFGIKGYGRYRVSYTTSEEGSGLSIRKLPYTIPAMNELDRFGFLKGIHDILNFKEVVPNGLILHTGITGSGKTTMIASEVDYIASKISGNILIFENPIEYKITLKKANIRHYEVGRHVKSFVEGMNIALRNNPTVVVIGEVRTREEIETLIEIASKGHLVFSTLHTSNAINTLRFIDEVGESKPSWKQLFANSIRAIISQKLIYRDGFILLAEVLIPDTVVRTKIAEGQYIEIDNMINSNQLRANGTISFMQAFDVLIRQNILSEKDKKELLLSIK